MFLVALLSPKLQAGLAPVISSVVREATGKYGFKAEFTTATVGTMSDLLSELSRRYYMHVYSRRLVASQSSKLMLREGCPSAWYVHDWVTRVNVTAKVDSGDGAVG